MLKEFIIAVIMIYKPFEVDVHTPLELQTCHIETSTAFFRGGSFLEEAIDLAITFNGCKPELSVWSAPSSVGAEADSIIAQAELQGYSGRLAITGLDINEQALEYARAGLYRSLWYPKGRNGQIMEDALQSWGFETRERQEWSRIGDEVLDSVLIDSNKLRSDKSVKFIQHDLLEPIVDIGPADLIFVNNLFVHLSKKEIKRILINLAENLADNGVISLGLNGLDNDHFGKRPLKTGWAVRMMKKKFDMLPLRGQYGHPKMFVRSWLHREVGLDLERIEVGLLSAKHAFPAT
jgi:chemotaxis methyl-accepting protein methylase